MTSNGGIGASKTLIPTSVAAAAPSKNDTNHHPVNGGKGFVRIWFHEIDS